MKIDLVVFDMAGTTVNDDDGVNRAVRDTLAAAGVEVSRAAVNEVMGIPKPLALTHLIEHSTRPDLVGRLESIHADFVRRMIHFYQTDPSVHEIAGAGDTFDRLKTAGIKVALDTGFSRAIVDVILSRLGWNQQDRVDATVASDEVQRGRPHPDMIEKAMHDLGVRDATRVAKVGDTPSDLQEGMSAGCGMVVGVTVGSHTAEQLGCAPHTHLIGSVVELPMLLGI
jgi:phosphonatase-like hydrolase